MEIQRGQKEVDRKKTRRTERERGRKQERQQPERDVKRRQPEPVETQTQRRTERKKAAATRKEEEERGERERNPIFLRGGSWVECPCHDVTAMSQTMPRDVSFQEPTASLTLRPLAIVPLPIALTPTSGGVLTVPDYLFWDVVVIPLWSPWR
ncbi:hypothetical protein LDENG_00159870 [Lucifuga dentata]|nr:hypothetical protein LDENG_00159870 [Lucifuga dentata]